MRNRLAVLATTLAVAVTGCVEVEEEFTLNPDGAGKVRHSMRMEVVEALLLDKNGKRTEPATLAKELARMTVLGSLGVEAWTDVTHGVDGEGRLFFQGTAYFRDLSKLRITERDSERMTPLPTMRWEKEGDAMILGLDDQDPAAPAPPSKLDAAEIERLAKRQREQWTQAKIMFGPHLRRLRLAMKFHVPGEVTRASQFQRNGGELSLEVDAEKLTKAMDALVADDAFMKRLAGRFGDVLEIPAEDRREVYEKVLGQSGPIQAAVRASAPLFDFQAEVAKAKPPKFD